jgi:hypothetical protein
MHDGMLARKAMQLLDRGRSERFILSPEAAIQIASWVAELPDDAGGDRELTSVLRMIAALERLDSPEAASTLIEALRNGAGARVRTCIGAREEGSRRSAERLFGAAPRKAPRIDEAPPRGSITVAAFDSTKVRKRR